MVQRVCSHRVGAALALQVVIFNIFNQMVNNLVPQRVEWTNPQQVRRDGKDDLQKDRPSLAPKGASSNMCSLDGQACSDSEKARCQGFSEGMRF